MSCRAHADRADGSRNAAATSGNLDASMKFSRFRVALRNAMRYVGDVSSTSSFDVVLGPEIFVSGPFYWLVSMSLQCRHTELRSGATSAP
jgi:hypothetical protein